MHRAQEKKTISSLIRAVTTAKHFLCRWHGCPFQFDPTPPPPLLSRIKKILLSASLPARPPPIPFLLLTLVILTDKANIPFSIFVVGVSACNVLHVQYIYARNGKCTLYIRIPQSSFLPRRKFVAACVSLCAPSPSPKKQSRNGDGFGRIFSLFFFWEVRGCWLQHTFFPLWNCRTEVDPFAFRDPPVWEMVFPSKKSFFEREPLLGGAFFFNFSPFKGGMHRLKNSSFPRKNEKKITVSLYRGNIKLYTSHYFGKCFTTTVMFAKKWVWKLPHENEKAIRQNVSWAKKYSKKSLLTPPLYMVFKKVSFFSPGSTRKCHDSPGKKKRRGKGGWVWGVQSAAVGGGWCQKGETPITHTQCPPKLSEILSLSSTLYLASQAWWSGEKKKDFFKRCENVSLTLFCGIVKGVEIWTFSFFFLPVCPLTGQTRPGVGSCMAGLRSWRLRGGHLSGWSSAGIQTEEINGFTGIGESVVFQRVKLYTT